MVKIGGVSIDVSHPKAFSAEMLDNNMDMRYEYVCKKSFRTDEECEWFANHIGAKVAAEIEDMADKVDIGFIQSCNWDKHLEYAMPFINAGTPVFIDKPVVGSYKDCLKLRELIKNGARVYGASAIRHADEIREFLAKDKEEVGEILSVYCTSGINEFDYTIHVVETIAQIVGAKAVKGKFVNSATSTDGVECDTFAIEFENGVNGFYTNRKGGWMPFHTTIVTTKGTYMFNASSNFYKNLLEEVYKEIAEGKSELADIESIINCCEVMICAKKSRDELNGEWVAIENLKPEDGFDGYAFESRYEQTCDRNLYKD